MVLGDGLREVLPERIGRYGILGELARGGMSRVLVAQRDNTPDLCVLKLLRGDLKAHQIAERRFFREAHLAAFLVHPRIARVLDAGFEDGVFCIAIEHIAGVTIEDLVRETGRDAHMLPYELSLATVLGALEGLDYAHDAVAPDGTPLELIHRDLSPRNLMLSFDGDPKIIDFGVARARLDDFRTEPGMIVGTLRYVSPEQAVAEPLDRRSDLYSLSVLLYELLSGRPLIPDGSPIQVLNDVLHRVPPPLSALNRELPRALDAVLERAMAKSPDDRYPDARSLAAAIEAAAGELGRAGRDKIGAFVRQVFPDALRDAQHLRAEALRRYREAHGPESGRARYTLTPPPELSGAWDARARVASGFPEEAAEEHWGLAPTVPAVVRPQDGALTPPPGAPWSSGAPPTAPALASAPVGGGRQAASPREEESTKLVGRPASLGLGLRAGSPVESDVLGPLGSAALRWDLALGSAPGAVDPQDVTDAAGSTELSLEELAGGPATVVAPGLGAARPAPEDVDTAADLEPAPAMPAAPSAAQAVGMSRAADVHDVSEHEGTAVLPAPVADPGEVTGPDPPDDAPELPTWTARPDAVAAEALRPPTRAPSLLVRPDVPRPRLLPRGNSGLAAELPTHRAPIRAPSVVAQMEAPTLDGTLRVEDLAARERAPPLARAPSVWGPPRASVSLGDPDEAHGPSTAVGVVSDAAAPTAPAAATAGPQTPPGVVRALSVAPWPLEADRTLPPGVARSVVPLLVEDDRTPAEEHVPTAAEHRSVSAIEAAPAARGQGLLPTVLLPQPVPPHLGSQARTHVSSPPSAPPHRAPSTVTAVVVTLALALAGLSVMLRVARSPGDAPLGAPLAGPLVPASDPVVTAPSLPPPAVVSVEASRDVPVARAAQPPSPSPQPAPVVRRRPPASTGRASSRTARPRPSRALAPDVAPMSEPAESAASGADPRGRVQAVIDRAHRARLADPARAAAYAALIVEASPWLEVTDDARVATAARGLETKLGELLGGR